MMTPRDVNIATTMLRASKLTQDQCVDAYEQFLEDCEEYSTATAFEKLESLLGD